MNKKFTLMDYFALVKLSLRDHMWRVDGKQTMKTHHDSTMKLIVGFLFFAFSIGAVILVLFSPIYLIKLLFSIITFSVDWADVQYVIWDTVSLFLVLALFWNPKRMKDAINYKKSTWYKNTGIHPSEVVSDVGVYGEYRATCSAERCLIKNNVQGRIFNNVIVPKKDGDFNEIDIVSVSEMGIHVIEAKARTGRFTGNLIQEDWTQNGNIVMKNPLKQNLGHCNYLAEYLYEKLPECNMKHISMLDYMTNVVVMVLTGIQDNLNRVLVPKMNVFFGMSAQYEKYKFDDITMTKQEVEMVCQILDEISHYTPAERQQMIQQRAAAQERKAYSHSYFYYIVKMECVNRNGEIYEITTICKDNGLYKTYLNPDSNWFMAIPNAVIKGKSQETEKYDEIVAYYNKMAAANI